jgi:mono/diheme cytochrome c family protein
MMSDDCRRDTSTQRFHKLLMLVIAAGMLAWLIGDTPTSAAGQKPTAAASPDATYKGVYEGWKWWHVYCYRCHGVNAIGGALAPNLISPNQQQSPAAFLKAVRNGKPDTAMQAWAPLLTNQQIGQIHLYVRARADKVLPPGRPDEVGPNKGKWVPPAGWPASVAAKK